MDKSKQKSDNPTNPTDGSSINLSRRNALKRIASVAGLIGIGMIPGAAFFKSNLVKGNPLSYDDYSSNVDYKSKVYVSGYYSCNTVNYYNSGNYYNSCNGYVISGVYTDCHDYYNYNEYSSSTYCVYF